MATKDPKWEILHQIYKVLERDFCEGSDTGLHEIDWMDYDPENVRMTFSFEGRTYSLYANDIKLEV